MKRVKDLSGQWELYLDASTMIKTPEYNDIILLPNTTSNAQKGEYNDARETGYLTDTYKFEGNAWFSREVEFSKGDNERVVISFERTRITTLYIDDKCVGKQESLLSPHCYDITDYVTNGIHKVSVCVSNVGYKTGGGHLTSPDTQTNWNGITGKLEVKYYDNTHIENCMIYPDIHNACVRIVADVVGTPNGVVEVSAQSFNSDKAHTPCTDMFKYENNKLNCIYKMGNFFYWSEYSPALYNIKLCVGEDVYEDSFGMREFSHDGNKFLINGTKTFLRGKHDGMIFPLTSFAPTDLDEWLRILKISKSYGINHYRYHTSCPPEAAFQAADMLGMYFEPQLPFWGTIYVEGEEQYNAEEQQFLVDEGFRILKTFGNHPSFCMMSMGNELWGSADRLNEIIGNYKKFDNRHLYTQGSNNFQWFPNQVENDDFFVGVRMAKGRLIRGSTAMCDAPQGHIQIDKPSTTNEYDSIINPVKTYSSADIDENGMVKIQYGTTMKLVKASEAEESFSPTVPIVTHEIGQYETFPNFDEIEKYTGSLKARNFEVFKETLDEKGMLELDKDFFENSGKLAVACYKEELEAVYRSKLIAGFQILDIQDFSGQGTALVGILDAFMDSKGLVSEVDWRKFCNDAVILACFDSFTLQGGDDFKAHIQLAYFRPESLENKKCVIKLSGSNFCETKEIAVPASTDNYIDICDFVTKLPAVTEPTCYTLEIAIEGTDISNSYDIIAYPSVADDEICIETYTEITDKALEKLTQGKTIVLTPKLNEDNSIEGTYCTDFWCYHMFTIISDMMKKPRPIGTMGLMIDNDHPALKKFPSMTYSTPQWWEIVSNSRSEIIEDKENVKDINVIVRTIDNFERCHNLALVYEYNYHGGKVVVCNFDFEKVSKSPEGRQLIKSIAEYIK